MTPAPKFLVIDVHAESRYLLVKTLLRKFPGAVIDESDDGEKAIEMARAFDLATIVTHRTFDQSGIELVEHLRDADPRVPIVMVSGIDRKEAALAAGATSFLPYDEWLRIGSVVEAHLGERRDGDPETDQSNVA